jgi:predicted anti-sigma-YlaC factor YlaD
MSDDYEPDEPPEHAAPCGCRCENQWEVKQHMKWCSECRDIRDAVTEDDDARIERQREQRRKST